MNFMDYLTWRGDITFDERPLNEVDNLIFSELAYLKMDELIPEGGITIAGLSDAFLASGYGRSPLVNDPLPLLQRLKDCPRYQNVIVRDYVNMVDSDKLIQFSAVTYCYRDGEAYIAYRGTDDTIVGWREDMNFSFQTRTPGQQESVVYLNRVARELTGALTVGGHSKGGNFAIYAAVFCDPEIRDRIVRIYSNDGPGFRSEIVNTANYQVILDRTVKIIPESSLVGILLSDREHRHVITSSAKGIMQHNPYTWNVRGTVFVEADERSAASVFMDDTLHRWLDTLSEDDMRVLVDTIFDVLEASGASTLSEINADKVTTYQAIIKAAAKIDPAARAELLGFLKKLFFSGREVMYDETRRSIERLLPFAGEDKDKSALPE